MGKLLKAFAPQSSYAAKKSTLWPDLMALLTDCSSSGEIDGFEEHLIQQQQLIPFTWRESLSELIEKRREEIADEAMRAGRYPA